MKFIMTSAVALACGFALSASAQQDDLPPPAPLDDPDGLSMTANIPPPAVVDAAADFYDELAPYGRWHYSGRHGYVWQPDDVNVGWRPYTQGSWAYTEDGWYWNSTQAWGDAPFHYGRWLHLPRRGWVWVPGRTWAPAWVVWRSGPGYLGWAPLPPEAYYDRNDGITWSISMDRSIYADGWVFVDDRHVMNPYVYGYIYPPRHNVVFFRSTVVYSPGYSYRGGRVYGGGVPLERVQRVTTHRIEPRRIDRSRARPHYDDPSVRSRGSRDAPTRNDSRTEPRRTESSRTAPSRAAPRKQGTAPRTRRR